MKWIGITGGIASGKSTVTKMIQDLGFSVIDADVLAREVVLPGTFGLKALVQQFGLEILSANQELNRSRLGQIIFQNQQKRVLLERILHPLIQWRALEERLLLERSGLAVAFYDAALIYEKELAHKFDGVILVDAAPDVQKKRLIARNNISTEDAVSRIAAQIPLEKKKQLANFVIDNSGDYQATEKQVRLVLEKIRN